MRSLLPVLMLAWVLLVSMPALAQTSHGDPFGVSAQYDQYDEPGPGAGHRAALDAMHHALMASGAIQTTPGEADATGENDASAAEPTSASGGPDAGSDGQEATEAASETQGANTPDIEKLPETGGPSPPWFGLSLVCAGALLARRALFP